MGVFIKRMNIQIGRRLLRIFIFAMLIGCTAQGTAARPRTHRHTLSTESTKNKMTTQKQPRMLTFLYKNRLGRLVRSALVAKKYPSVIASGFANSRFSRFFIKSFVRRNNINLDECIIPAGGFRSFNDFFYRTLKPGARQIDQRPEVITSPADSKILVIENIQPGTTFGVKNIPFNLARLVQNDALAHEFYGGTLMIFRLAPQDYHRFHFPCAGTPATVEKIPGKYESVHPLVYQCGVQPLTENERHLIRINTETCGTVLCVPVGALLVGKIIETYQPNTKQAKGAEMGYFAFGGSSIVMLFKAGAIKLDPCLTAATNGTEVPVRMGQAIAHINS